MRQVAFKGDHPVDKVGCERILPKRLVLRIRCEDRDAAASEGIPDTREDPKIVKAFRGPEPG